MLQEPREETVEELVEAWRKIFGARRLESENFKSLIDRILKQHPYEDSEIREAIYAAIDVSNATLDMKPEIRAMLDVLERMEERIKSIERTVNHLIDMQDVRSDQFEDALAAHDNGDYATALRVWQPLAEQGNARAQYSLGIMYKNGQGVPQDYAAALKWYRLAAEQGNADAQYSLGVTYDLGQGVPQDYAAAVKWYRLAAEQGLAHAQYNLGFMYAQGQGAPQDDTAALKWWRLAADQGDTHAEYGLGQMYRQALGVPQDDAAAMKWYRLAAEQGHADAQLNLCVMYAVGQGVPHDYVQAHMWLNLAASSGDKDIAEFRDEVAAEMTPADISKAQKLASEWKPKTWDELKGQLPQ